RTRRLRGLPAPTRRGTLGAHPPPHCGGRGRRPSGRARRRRRRLHPEAVLVRGAVRPAAGTHPSRRPPATARPRGRRSGTRPGPPPRHPRRRGDRFEPEGVRAPRPVHAARRRGPQPHDDPRARLGLRLRRHLERRRRLRAVPAREDRPAVRPRDARNRPRGRLPAPDRRVRLRPRTLRGRLTLVFALVTAALFLLVGVLLDVPYPDAPPRPPARGLLTPVPEPQRHPAARRERTSERAHPQTGAT